MNSDAYSELAASLPPIIARTEVPKLTGNLISSGHLANLDCLGQGPKNVVKCGKKVGYTRDSFIEWLRGRGEKQP